MSEEMTLSNERLAEMLDSMKGAHPDLVAALRELQALRASSGVEVKQFPAGWLIRENEHDLWDFCRLKKAADDLTVRGYEVIPLFASPLPTVEVTEETQRLVRFELEQMNSNGCLTVYEIQDDRGLDIDEYVDLFMHLLRALSQNKGEE